jgi:hypothetical protein
MSIESVWPIIKSFKVLHIFGFYNVLSREKINLKNSKNSEKKRIK